MEYGDADDGKKIELVCCNLDEGARSKFKDAWKGNVMTGSGWWMHCPMIDGVMDWSDDDFNWR